MILDEAAWKKADSVFRRFLDIGGDRDELVEESGLDDSSRECLRLLLDAHFSESDTMDRSLEDWIRLTPKAISPTRDPSDQVGPWTLDSLLGTGGMGQVYRAHRWLDSVRQDVALKVLNPAVCSDTTRDRFHREQTILSRLDHPSIASFIDAGVDARGIPYLAMQCVDGIRIDEFVADRGLSADQVVSLMMQACDAVIYSHKRLVVHRDIKPSNLMVTDQGRVVLLDFGIASLLAAEDESVTATLAVSRGYSAPEQLRGDAISTAADVYSLGALLYRLLGSGPPPPAMPDSETPLSPANADRDLYNILLACLRYDPDQRYAGVADLRADLSAWRSGQPVRATGNSLGYRIGKFYRRNRASVFASGMLLVIAFAGLGGFVIQWQRAVASAAAATAALGEARQQQQTADASLGFLVNILSAANPELSGGDAPSVEQLFKLGAVEAEQRFSDQPVLLNRLRHAFAEIYLGLGDDRLAADLWGRVLASDHGGSSLQRGAQLGLARANLAASNYREAEQTLNELRDLPLPDALMTRVLIASAELATRRSEFEPAKQWLHTAEQLAPDPATLLDVQVTLFEVSVQESDLETAARGATPAIASARAQGRVAVEARLLSVLAQLQQDLGETDGALNSVEEAAIAIEQIYPEDHPLAIENLLRASSVHRARGAANDAEVAALEALKLLGNRVHDHNLGAEATNMLAVLAFDEGRLDDAVRWTTEALAVTETIEGTDAADAGTLHANLSGYYRLQGDAESALSEAVIATDIHAQSLPLTHPARLDSYAHLANAYRLQGDLPQALGAYEKILSGALESLGERHLSVVSARANIGSILMDMGKDFRRADAELSAAFASAKAMFPPEAPPIHGIRHSLVQAKLLIGDTRTAAEELENYRAVLEEDELPPNTSGRTVLLFAMLRQQQGNLSAARSLLQRSREIFATTPDGGARYQRAVDRLAAELNNA